MSVGQLHCLDEQLGPPIVIQNPLFDRNVVEDGYIQVQGANLYAANQRSSFSTEDLGLGDPMHACGQGLAHTGIH